MKKLPDQFDAAFLGKGMPAYMEEATADSLPPMDEEDGDG